MAHLISRNMPTFRLQTPGVPPRYQAVFRNAEVRSSVPAVIRHALSRDDIGVHLDQGEEYLLIGSGVQGLTTLPNGQLVTPDEIASLALSPMPGSVAQTVPSRPPGQTWEGPPLDPAATPRPMCIDCGADFANAGLLGLHKKREHGATADVEADLVPA